MPQSGRVMTTVDVAFDEDFSSQGLAYDKTLYHDALSVRGDTALYIDETRTFAQTGPPQGLEFFLYDKDWDDGSYDSDELHKSTTMKSTMSTPLS